MNARATMQRAAAAAVTLALLTGTAACSSGSSAGTEEPPAPATLQTLKAGAPPKVSLTDDALHRIGLQTTAVRHARVTVAGRPASAIVVPYAAVVYDGDGTSWAYAQVAPGAFVRQPIALTAVQGDTAILSKGPADGTEVVTVGAPLLVGVEAQIAGEE